MVELLKKVGCMSLHTTGLVVGWLGVVSAIIAFILSGWVLMCSDKATDFFLKALHVESDPDTHESFETVVVIYASIYLVSSVISGVVSGMLISGTKQNKPKLFLPWLILNGIGIVLSILSLIGAAGGMFMGSAASTSNFFSTVFTCVTYVYFYWGIYSLYKHIQANYENGRVVSPPPAAMPLQQQDPNYHVYNKV